MKAAVRDHISIYCPQCNHVMFMSGAPEEPTVECMSIACDNRGKVFTYKPLVPVVELREKVDS